MPQQPFFGASPYLRIGMFAEQRADARIQHHDAQHVDACELNRHGLPETVVADR